MSTIAAATPSGLSQGDADRPDSGVTMIGDWNAHEHMASGPYCVELCCGLELWKVGDSCARFERCMVIDGELSRWKQIQEDIVTLAELYEFSDVDQYAIRISLEEAIVNAVEHGNDGDRTKRVHIDYTVSDAVVRVRIADEGPGFDPEAVPDPTLPENLERPNGRGLMMMRHYMTGVRHNDRGNCVEMWKQKRAPRCDN